MSRSCHSGTFSNPTGRWRGPPGPVRRSARCDRVLLVRHRRRALLARGERLRGLAHLGALQVADLGREPVERRAGDAIARAAAWRAGRGGSPASRRPRAPGRAPQGEVLDRGGRSWRRCRRRRTACRPRTPLEGGGQPVAVAAELGHPAQQLEPEGGRLGVDAVRPADGRGVAVLLGAHSTARSARSTARQQQLTGVAQLQRRARCRRRPTRSARSGTTAPPGPTCSDTDSVNASTSWCVRDSISRMRATSTDARLRTAATASAGTTPRSAHPAIAAISTSSHRWNRRSSDQTAPISGRV